MKVVIFGTGKYYQRRKDKISPDTEIVAFLDNNLQLAGKFIDGIQIFSPYKIEQISYDKIVLMSAKKTEMHEQLIKLKIPEENIWSWEQLNSEMWHGIFRFHVGNVRLRKAGKKVLIISTELNYNGGTLAAVYAAFALQSRGFNVVLASPAGSSKFITEMTDRGINIVVCPGMPYLKNEELFFIKQFDIVIVNVFQMISCACEISKIRPTMWWIHEPSVMYNNIIEEFPEYIDEDKLKKINIYAVSSIAQKNFNYYFPGRIEKKLFYGLPDQKGKAISKEKKVHLIFAIIGAVCPIKAQHIFIRAAQLLSDKDKKKIQCWIIGSIGTGEYSDKVVDLVSKDSSFKLMGELTRCEMQDVYKKIDVVVCSSIEDCMPVTVTEGMMYEKICIVSDHTGSAEYIEDGVNGFVVPVNNIIALKNKMEWVISNKEKRKEIGKNARETYKKYFAMDVFGSNLEEAVNETIGGWHLNDVLL